MNDLHAVDPEIASAIEDEAASQAMTLELNAAANFSTAAVLDVQGSVLAHRTLEGYPGARYHGGHRQADIIEKIAVERAKRLFGADHANVQPHCGTNANLAVYFAALEPGDTILGMALASGGHLSHGHKASFSGKYFRSFSYGVNPETEIIDYDAARDIALRVKPKLVICGASSYPKVIDFRRFREIADEAGACLLADIAHVAGLVAGKVYPSPVPLADFVTFTGYKTLQGSRGGIILCKKTYARKIDSAVFPGIQGSMHLNLMAGKAVTFRLASTDAFKAYAGKVIENARALAAALKDRGYRIVCGGTDTHIVLLDLRSKGLTGVAAQESLENVGITCNKNAIPFDPLGPEVTSGLRLGTGAVTTRGLSVPEMGKLADLIDRVLSKPSSKTEKQMARDQVRDMCRHFPLQFSRP
ncbi:MAG: serine hydroxymethyltransferase [Desulfatiglandaceae bacterium]|jgi:glycine hydroxymethyltransferase